MAGSACTRFGVFEAGQESAHDPKYTVIPQRERLNKRRAAEAAARDAEADSASDQEDTHDVTPPPPTTPPAAAGDWWPPDCCCSSRSAPSTPGACSARPCRARTPFKLSKVRGDAALRGDHRDDLHRHLHRGPDPGQARPAHRRADRGGHLRDRRHHRVLRHRTATSCRCWCSATACIGGFGLGLAYIVPIAMLQKWFPDRRGLITGLAVGGFGFGAVITAPIAQRLDRRATRTTLRRPSCRSASPTWSLPCSVPLLQEPAAGLLRAGLRAGDPGRVVDSGRDYTQGEAVRTLAVVRADRDFDPGRASPGSR